MERKTPIGPPPKTAILAEISADGFISSILIAIEKRRMRETIRKHLLSFSFSGLRKEQIKTEWVCDFIRFQKETPQIVFFHILDLFFHRFDKLRDLSSK